ncbi:MAG: RHS repeat-associated core domain-containing protein [Gammaproteobacteria bacterium]|nr:RHS repeat-associated core domain-containing protein [Gammaproteobacteria bacterium]
MDFDGAIKEKLVYDAYGRPHAFSPGDLKTSGGADRPDGLLDANDTWTTGSVVWNKDIGNGSGVAIPDGTVTSADGTTLTNLKAAGYSAGYGIISDATIDNRKGLAGYEFDPVLEGNAAQDTKPIYHVRHRVLASDTGKWLQKDPLGYHDSMDLYEYCKSDAIDRADPTGREMAPVPCSPCATEDCCRSCCQSQYPRYVELCMSRCPGNKGTSPTGPLSCQLDCCKWYESEKRRIKGTRWLDSLPNCPCSIGVPASNPDPETWADPSPADPAFHPGGGGNCMRSRAPREWDPSGSGQQCCYDKNGNLITDGPAAGTPDASAPWGPLGIFDHWREDVRPFKWCRDAGMLDKYLALRPPNNGNKCAWNGTPPLRTTNCQSILQQADPEWTP